MRIRDTVLCGQRSGRLLNRGSLGRHLFLPRSLQESSFPAAFATGAPPLSSVCRALVAELGYTRRLESAGVSSNRVTLAVSESATWEMDLR